MGDSLTGELSYEEWQVEKALEEGDLACPSCGEELHVSEDLLLLQVVTPTSVGGLIVDTPLEENGEYKYDPFFFHIACWNTLWDDLFEKDTYPVREDSPNLLLAECEICGSTIRNGELSGTMTLGEIKSSPRQPNQEPTSHFHGHGEADHLCISCLYVFNDEVIGVWDDLTFGTVCPNGLHIRCWRDGNCGQGCRFNASK